MYLTQDPRKKMVVLRSSLSSSSQSHLIPASKIVIDQYESPNPAIPEAIRDWRIPALLYLFGLWHDDRWAEYRLSLYWCLWQNSLSKLIGFIQQKILHIQIMGQDHSQEKKTKLCVYILLIKLERNLKSLIIWAFHITPHTYLIHFRPWCYIPGVCWFINLSWNTIPFLFASLKEFSSSYV